MIGPTALFDMKVQEFRLLSLHNASQDNVFFVAFYPISSTLDLLNICNRRLLTRSSGVTLLASSRRGRRQRLRLIRHDELHLRINHAMVNDIKRSRRRRLRSVFLRPQRLRKIRPWIELSVKNSGILLFAVCSLCQQKNIIFFLQTEESVDVNRPQTV